MISFIVEDAEGTRRIEFPETVVSIGRDPSSLLRIEDDLISRQHAEVRVENGGVWLFDLDSSNGTFRGEDRVKRALLRRGDRFSVGRTTLTFVADDHVEREPTLVSFDMQSGEEGELRIIDFATLPATIGRRSGCDLVLDDQEASGQHARLLANEGAVLIEDLGSSNGTWKNGKRIRRAILDEGDELTIGDTRLHFIHSELPIEPLPSSFEVPGVTLVERLAVGSRSVVWKGKQLALDREVVVRVLRPSLARARATAGLFQRQTRIQSRVQHHGLARGIDVGESEGLPWFLGEAVEGRSFIEALRGSFGLSPEIVARTMIDLLEVVEALHEQGGNLGFLPPRRVMITEEGHTKLLSCGFPFPTLSEYPAERVDELATLAPELAAGESAGVASDLYAIGAFAHHLLAGRPPRSSETLEEMRDELQTVPLPPPVRSQGRGVPAPLREIIEELCAFDPQDRPADPAEVRARLAAGVDSLGGLSAAAAGGEVRSADEQEAAALRAHQQKVKKISRVVTVIIFLGLNGGLFLAWPTIMKAIGMGKKSKQEAPPVVVVEEQRPRMQNVPPSGTDHQAQARKEREAAWAEVQARADEADHPARKVELFRKFAEQHTGTNEGAAALQRSTETQKEWREAAIAALDGLAGSIAKRNLEAARLQVDATRRICEGIAEGRFEQLMGELRALEARVASGAAKPGETTPGKAPVKAPAPEDDLPALLTAARKRPWLASARKAVLARRDDKQWTGDEQEELRRLEVLGRCLDEAVEVAKAQKTELTLPDGEKTVSGTLKAFADDRLVLTTAEGELTIESDRFGPGLCVAILVAGKAGPQNYFCRGWLNGLASLGDEAWFDYQGVILTAPPESWEATAARAALERLRAEGVSPMK